MHDINHLDEIRIRDVALTQNAFTKLSAGAGVKYLEVIPISAGAIELAYGAEPWALSFDGGDHVDVDDLADALASLAPTKGYVTARILPATGLAASATIFSLSVAAGDGYLALYLDSNYKLTASLVDAAGDAQWTLATTEALTTAWWYNVALVHDGVAPYLLVNGAQVPQAFSVTTDKTKWIAGVVGVDAGRVGDLRTGLAESLWWSGKIADVLVCNQLPGELRRAPYAHYRCAEGTGTTLGDDVNALDGTFGAAGAAPTWAEYQAGDPLGDGIWYDDPIPNIPVWGFTADADQSVTVKEGF